MVDGVHGLYTDDTRLLSCSRLTVDGASPLLLTSQVVEYFDSAHYLRNAPTDGVPVDAISIARERFVGEALTERFVLRNETPVPRTVTVGLDLASDFADIISVKAHDFALGDPSRAEPLPSRVHPTQPAPATLELHDPDELVGDPDHVLASGRARRKPRLVPGAPRAEGNLGARRPDRARRPAAGAARRQAALRQRARARPQVARRLADPRPAAPRGVGGARAVLRAVARRPRVAPPEGAGVVARAARGRHAVVHDALRSRHADHLAPDDAVRTGARDGRAARPRRPPGDRGRPGDRRRARQDPPRAAARQGRGVLVPGLLRHGRRHAALPRAPLRGLALDGRRRARPRAGAGRPGSARLDRRLRRPRRRRVRGVRAPGAERARKPVLEGLGRLAAVPGRPARGRADRPRRGAGLRLRRAAPAGGAGTGGLARPRARGRARATGRRASRPLRSRLLARGPGSVRARPSTARSVPSTRSPRTTGTCCGRGSSPTGASRT